MSEGGLSSATLDGFVGLLITQTDKLDNDMDVTTQNRLFCLLFIYGEINFQLTRAVFSCVNGSRPAYDVSSEYLPPPAAVLWCLRSQKKLLNEGSSIQWRRSCGKLPAALQNRPLRSNWL